MPVIAAQVERAPSIPQRWIAQLDLAFIYSSIILIPFDLPAVHQACLPLTALAILLMVLRRDGGSFLSFIRELPLLTFLAMLLCAISILGLFGNMGDILGSVFQMQQGWVRAVSQLVLLYATLFFCFYLGFCLRRHPDWQSIIIRAAWWSLPVPCLIGLLQVAYMLGAHALSNIPYVVNAYQEGGGRVTSVAREAGWFGSYACVVLPFLLIGYRRTASRWRKLAGGGGGAAVLIVLAFGFSKSSFGGLGVEVLVAVLVTLVLRPPWRLFARLLFFLLLLVITGLFFFTLAPGVAGKITGPFVDRLTLVYNLFLPLITGDTHFASIGTRFGMATAGNAMGLAHPGLGVGLGQFGFHVYNYMPVWGLNGETAAWLSNTPGNWPSTTNLPSRLLAETGIGGLLLYTAFRLVLMAGVGLRAFNRQNLLWGRDEAVFCILVALVVFDFHRDSFINQDILTAMAMGLACISERATARRAPAATGTWRLFGWTMTAAFVIALMVILPLGVAYRASATLAPKVSSVLVEASPDEGATPDVQMTNGGSGRFKLFHQFWASRTAAARLLAARPDLVRSVLMHDGPVTPPELAGYIHDNVTVLMDANLATLTFQYRNRDPHVAEEFLRATIAQTDVAVANVSRTMTRQAAQLSRIAILQSQDLDARRMLINSAAAQELQAALDTPGENNSFDYIEHPHSSAEDVTPEPAVALVFAVVLALLTSLLALAVHWIWPMRLSRGLGAPTVHEPI